MALSKLGDANVKPSCVQGSDADVCMKKIKNGNAALITLDGGEIYRAGIVRIGYCTLKEAFLICASKAHDRCGEAKIWQGFVQNTYH